MDGVVTRLAVREGEMVVMGVQNQPGTILMTLSDLSTINAEVKVAEADVLRLMQEALASSIHETFFLIVFAAAVSLGIMFFFPRGRAQDLQAGAAGQEQAGIAGPRGGASAPRE